MWGQSCKNGSLRHCGCLETCCIRWVLRSSCEACAALQKAKEQWAAGDCAAAAATECCKLCSIASPPERRLQTAELMLFMKSTQLTSCAAAAGHHLLWLQVKPHVDHTWVRLKGDDDESSVNEALLAAIQADPDYQAGRARVLLFTRNTVNADRVSNHNMHWLLLFASCAALAAKFSVAWPSCRGGCWLPMYNCTRVWLQLPGCLVHSLLLQDASF